MNETVTITIPKQLHDKLMTLGLLPDENNSYSQCRNGNEGASNYSSRIIQPWAIWMDWELNPWDADIIKRTLRTKETDGRALDYKKIIHICNERLRQLYYDENK